MEFFADTDAFPPWMLWASLGFSSSAIVLFLVGLVRGRPTYAVAAPAELPAPDSVAPPPPALVPVAGVPLHHQENVTERRVGFRRVGNPVEVLVCVGDCKSQANRGWVIDRSRHGLRLSLHDKCDNGTILQVRPVRAPKTVPWQSVEVRNAQPGEQCWELGCRFTVDPPWEVLLLFG